MVQTITKKERPAYDVNLHIKLATCKKQIHEMETKVQSLRQQQQNLKDRQTIICNSSSTSTKLQSWKTMYNIEKLPDGSLRPPDKSFNVRAYSNMDKTLWGGGTRGETMRGWFQDQKDPEFSGTGILPAKSQQFQFNPMESGLLQTNTNLRPAVDPGPKEAYKSRILNMSPYTVPMVPAGEYFSMPTYRSEA